MDSTADRMHDVRSAGKSVTTLMIGRSIEDGAAFSPEARIASILKADPPFANDDPRKDAITVGNLMSMTAGYACDDNDDASPGNEDSNAVPNGAARIGTDIRSTFQCSFLRARGRSIAAPRSTCWGRSSQKRPANGCPTYFYERFAQPMQFGRYGMKLMPPPISDAYMGGGDFFRPRDFLKFGQLLLSGGRWNGTPVIDAAWLKQISTKRSYMEQDGGEPGQMAGT